MDKFSICTHEPKSQNFFNLKLFGTFGKNVHVDWALPPRGLAPHGESWIRCAINKRVLGIVNGMLMHTGSIYQRCYFSFIHECKFCAYREILFLVLCKVCRRTIIFGLISGATPDRLSLESIWMYSTLFIPGSANNKSLLSGIGTCRWTNFE